MKLRDRFRKDGPSVEDQRKNERDMEDVKRRLARVEANVRALQVTQRRLAEE